MTTGQDTATATLRALQQNGCTRAQAQELFDGLPAAQVSDLAPGRWVGSELATGHTFDGLLAASGWYGKEFRSAEEVDPLLFRNNTPVFAVNPGLLPPMSVIAQVPRPLVALAKKGLPVLRFLLGTRKGRARLRLVEHRGVQTVAMVYDQKPIIDVFRKVSDSTLLGVMDCRGLDEPYFFVLDRE